MYASLWCLNSIIDVFVCFENKTIKKIDKYNHHHYLKIARTRTFLSLLLLSIWIIIFFNLILKWKNLNIPYPNRMYWSKRKCRINQIKQYTSESTWDWILSFEKNFIHSINQSIINKSLTIGHRPFFSKGILHWLNITTTTTVIIIIIIRFDSQIWFLSKKFQCFFYPPKKKENWWMTNSNVSFFCCKILFGDNFIM